LKEQTVAVASELAINTGATAMQMADSMFGTGINILSASFTGAAASSGIYSGGLTTSPGVVPSDTGVILSTGKASDFTNSSGDPNHSAQTSTQMNTAGDAQLTQISGSPTYDAAVFNASFIPDGDTLTMQIVFSSEEYLEYVGSQFNDACAIWVNGVQAQLTVGTGDITINNVNTTSNSNLYVNNPSSSDPYNTEMDGFTVTLTLKAPVIPGKTNTIKIAIADAGDRIYDSNLLIAGNSIQCSLVAGDDTITAVQDNPVTYDILANDHANSGGTLTITQINGQDVHAGSVVVLSTGETITVNADGTITVVTNGTIASNTFTYTVSDGLGNTDVAFVTVNCVPCFVRGTLIRSARGDVPVEDLAIGDRVVTRDHGLQPIRWIGSRSVAGTGTMAPVVIDADALGVHDRLVVSQQHRVLVRGPQAVLACGVSEVLVKARHLVNDRSVTLDRSGDDVEYFHVLFDEHEIIWSNGLETESFHPGKLTLAGMDEDARREIFSLFPELDVETGEGYGPSARPDARGHEAAVLSVLTRT
jgi:hypothetical protein